MSRFELYPQSFISHDNEVFGEIQNAGANRKLLVDILVRETQRIIPLVQVKHKGKIEMYLKDHSNDTGTDMYGWVLYVRQLLIKPEWGFTQEDPYLSHVLKVEVSELEINEGQTKFSITESICGESLQFDDFGVTQSVTPSDFVTYLHSVLASGNARPRMFE